MHMGYGFSLPALKMNCFFPDLTSIPLFPSIPFLGWDPGIPPLVSPIGPYTLSAIDPNWVCHRPDTRDLRVVAPIRKPRHFPVVPGTPKLY